MHRNWSRCAPVCVMCIWVWQCLSFHWLLGMMLHGVPVASVLLKLWTCCSWSRVIEEMHTWSFSILILPMQVLVAYWNILNLYNFCYLYVLAGFLTGGIFKCWVHDADLGKCNRMYRWVHSDAVYLSVMLHWLQLLCFSFAVYIIVITEADWVSDQANH